jgi:hypothetical protein
LQPAVVPIAKSYNLGYEIDLHAGTEWDLSYTERSSRVCPNLAKYFLKKLGSAVCNQMLLGEYRIAIHED